MILYLYQVNTFSVCKDHHRHPDANRKFAGCAEIFASGTQDGNSILGLVQMSIDRSFTDGRKDM
jgi:hypothetical protein